jgi:peptidyl-prolyl cis-trans isomerase C
LLPRNSRISWSIPLFLAGFLVTAGCGDRRGGEAYVARVDNAVLTQNDISASGDSLNAAALSREFIDEWVVNELLFQEADRRGLLDRDDVRRQVKSATRQLAVAALLREELFEKLDTSSITDEAVARMLADHPADFLLREDVLQTSYVLFTTREAANLFRSSVLRGMTWDEAATKVRTDSTQAPFVIRTTDRQFFTRGSLYPDELWRLARSLSRGDVSFPLKTGDGYYILQVHSLLQQGETPPIEYARPYVRQRLLMDLRRARLDELVASLREQRRVDIRMEGHPSSGSPLP